MLGKGSSSKNVHERLLPGRQPENPIQNQEMVVVHQTRSKGVSWEAIVDDWGHARFLKPLASGPSVLFDPSNHRLEKTCLEPESTLMRTRHSRHGKDMP